MAGSTQGRPEKKGGKGQPAIKAGFELASPSVQTERQNQGSFGFSFIFNLTASPNSHPASS
jgi:hypothetical protein